MGFGAAGDSMNVFSTYALTAAEAGFLSGVQIL